MGLSQHAPSCALSVHFRPDLQPTGRGIHTGLSTVDSEAAEPNHRRAGHIRQAGAMPGCGEGPGSPAGSWAAQSLDKEHTATRLPGKGSGL